MSFSLNSSRRYLASSLRRRNQRMSMASVDVAADRHGRRTNGDPRLDLVLVDTTVRF